MTVQAMAEAILEITGGGSKIVYHDLPEDDPKVRQPDISLAKSKLDWEPRVDIREGLLQTVEYFRGAIKNHNAAGDR
jgi:nucleoside-diphosphate-sugar epimerase